MKGRSSTTVLGFPFFAQRSGNPMLAQQKFWERCFAKEEEARGVAKWDLAGHQATKDRLAAVRRGLSCGW